MHDPALAAGRIWSPCRETARLAAFRSLAFPAGPWPAIRPPVRHHLARGPWPGQTGPASVADQQTAHVMAVAAAPPHHRGQPSRPSPNRPPPAASSRGDNPADRWPRLAAGPPGHWGGPADRAVREAAVWKSGHPGPGPPRPPAPRPLARRLPPPAMTAGPSGDDKDADLDRLTRQYPQWRMWRGRATGDYWAMPPRGHRHEAALGLVAVGPVDTRQCAGPASPAARQPAYLIRRVPQSVRGQRLGRGQTRPARAAPG